MAAKSEAITILRAEARSGFGTESDMSDRKSRPESRTRATALRPAAAAPSRGIDTVAADGFFRDLVWSLRNGVLAVTRDGRVAVMNDVAYRILGWSRGRPTSASPSPRCCKNQQDVCRIVAGAFELSHLPNRAELRLKSTGKVIGYTLSQVRDRDGAITGAALFFKDLTRVEQLEERERLRDRLAALGEMAAAIAHEVKNPLAGIEVMAGLLKRQLADSEDAQSILGDIIKEAKMANAIVLEVLDFVRPIRLQVERISVTDAIRDAVSMAESHVPRGDVEVAVEFAGAAAGDPGRPAPAAADLHEPADQRVRGAGRRGSGDDHRRRRCNEDGPAGGEPQGPMVQVEVTDDGPGMPADVVDKIFSPFFTTKPQGSGLGLAIVRKIVDAHDGRIDVARARNGRDAVPRHAAGDRKPSVVRMKESSEWAAFS